MAEVEAAEVVEWDEAELVLEPDEVDELVELAEELEEALELELELELVAEALVEEPVAGALLW